MSAKKARYCIGELSTLCNIPQKTLRYYDEIGLFTPDYRDDSTHYRYYSKSQIVNLMIIKTLKQMGFPLKDIRQIISENDAQSLEANINSHLETMRDDIMKRIDQYTECNYLLQKIQNGIDILEASSSLPSEDLAISIEHIPKISLMYDRSEMEGYDYSETVSYTHLIFAILQLIPNLVNTLIFMVMRLLVSSMRFLLPAQNIKLVTVCIFILLIIVCNVNHVELAIVKCVKILEII